MIRPRHAVAWLLVLAATSVTMGAALVRLEREDVLGRCRFVAVLNGDQPARADTAARILLSGYASVVWLTNDPRSGASSLDDAGTMSNIRRLAEQGISPSAIHVLDGPAEGTRAELRLIAGEARRQASPCAIVVTSPAHVARVRVAWRGLAEPKPTLIVRHAIGAGYAGWRVRAREFALIIATLGGGPR
jgi:hypothetical protein